jgi:hypothetical protein
MSYYGSEGQGPAADPWEHSAPLGYDLDLGYTQPVPRESAGSRALLIVLVVVLVVVLCGGGVAGLYLLGKGNQSSTGGGATGHTSASSTLDPTTIRIGDCIVNDGTDDAPKIRTVTCAPHTLKVIGKINGTTDQNQCKQIAGANRAYFYKTANDSEDFVLCLQIQS